MTPAEKILWAHMEDVPEHKRIFDEDVFGHNHMWVSDRKTGKRLIFVEF